MSEAATRQGAQEPSWNAAKPELDRALGKLGDRERGAILLRFLENRTYADIGRMLRISTRTIRCPLSKAMPCRGA